MREGTKRRLAHVDLVRRYMALSQASWVQRQVGDVWSYKILRQAFYGGHGFDAFIDTTGIPRGTLTARLKHLIDSGLLQRNADNRRQFELTAAGQDLFGYFVLFDDWASKWWMPEDNGQGIGLCAENCAHCGANMNPALVCKSCGHEFIARQVAVNPGNDPVPDVAFPAIADNGRRQQYNIQNLGHDAWLYLTADRWSTHVIACQFFGLRRFNDIQQTIGIASNILADRLQRLVAAAILVPHTRGGTEGRAEYILSVKGLAMYQPTLESILWAQRNLSGEHTAALPLVHRLCGEPVRGTIVCKACNGGLNSNHLRN